jgi:hypothetical protein
MPGFKEILLLVGQLNYTWTNTESLLIHLIAGLARVDKETAIVIFLTLNTTRARLDLVERLAKMAATPKDCRDAVLELTERMNREARLRNKYNHCIYAFDEAGEAGQTQLMRIFENRNEIRYGKTEDLDEREVGRIKTCIGNIADINRGIWQVVRNNGFPQ